MFPCRILLSKAAQRESIKLHPSVAQYLFPHQVAGVQWLHRLLSFSESEFQGGVLADEMGLGKTIYDEMDVKIKKVKIERWFEVLVMKK